MSSNHKLLKEALRIRLIEEKIIEVYPTDVIQSPVHLSIGQEAVAVGICNNLSKNDVLFINYRGHAFYLAKGGDLYRFFAELMGKSTGISKGKAGSMHLAYPEKGVMGASAIVAASIPHAVGYALSQTLFSTRKRKNICVVFGDGAIEQGVFHESLNFASLHNLQVVFICEDNGLAVHIKKNKRQVFNLKDLVESYDIKYFEIENGIDPERVSSKFRIALNYQRNRKCPIFVHVQSRRYLEHVGPGKDWDKGYRSLQTFKKWQKEDPVEQFRLNNSSLIDNILEEINTAFNKAIGDSNPTESEVLTDVL